MNWEAVSAIAEVAGVIAIVASLAYIGSQTKQSNEHASAVSEIAWINALNQIFNGWVSDERTSSAMRDGFQSFNNLSKSDKAIFQVRVGSLVNHWLLAQDLAGKRLLPKEISDVATKLAIAVLSTPGGFQYWEYDSKITPGGQELLQMVKEKKDQQPSWIELMPWWSPDHNR